MANLKKSHLIETGTTTASKPRDPLVALYCRVSSDKQSREATIDRQLSLTKEIYKRSFGSDPRAKLVGSFEDNGYNLENRDEGRQFWRLMREVKLRKVNTIIVVSEDRIFRGESAALRGEITDILRHYGVRLITSSGANTYSRGETSARLVSSITQELGAISKLETVRTLQHGRRRKLAENDAWFLSICPFGLRCNRRVENHQKIYDYSIVQEEAEVVRDVFRLYVGMPTKVLPRQSPLKPIGATRIAGLLNAAKIDRSKWAATLPEGMTREDWDKQNVLRMLRNSTYTGELTVVFQPTTKVAGYEAITTSKTIPIPVIISPELFAKAQAIHQKRRENLLDDYAPRKDTNWLHGLIACPVCATRLRGRMANQGTRYYGCPETSTKKPHGLFRAEDIEPTVGEELTELLLEKVRFEKLLAAIKNQQSGSGKRAELRKRVDAIAIELEKCSKRQEKLALSWADGTLEDETYRNLIKQLKSAAVKLKSEGAEIREALSESEVGQQAIGSLSDVRDLLIKALDNPTKKQKILALAARQIVERVELRPLKPLNVARMDDSAIKVAYSLGRILPKDLKAAGWSVRRIFSELGRTGRKMPMTHQPVIVFRGTGKSVGTRRSRSRQASPEREM